MGQKGGKDKRTCLQLKMRQESVLILFPAPAVPRTYNVSKNRYRFHVQSYRSGTSNRPGLGCSIGSVDVAKSGGRACVLHAEKWTRWARRTYYGNACRINL